MKKQRGKRIKGRSCTYISCWPLCLSAHALHLISADCPVTLTSDSISDHFPGGHLRNPCVCMCECMCPSGSKAQSCSQRHRTKQPLNARIYARLSAGCCESVHSTVVLNVRLIVPFILAPMINATITYFAMATGLVIR